MPAVLPTPTPVTQDLAARQIPFRFFQHAGGLHSLEQAARERGQQPEQVVRSLLFRLRAGAFVMVLVAGPAQVSWTALRRYLNQSRLTLASEEEVLEVTGYPRGAVSPFGLPQPLRILVDRSVLVPDELSLGAGVRNAAVILRSTDLLRALGAVEIGDFTQPG
jgi:Cys-tRNA(Pro)/Cys-tRNA(Cys) deacylase